MCTYINRSRLIGVLSLSLALLVGLADVARAQFGRGQRGGGFGRGFAAAQEFTELGSTVVQEELQLTGEQIAAVEEFSETYAAGTQELFTLSTQVRQADSDEERAAAEAELAAFRDRRATELRTGLEQILDDAQLERLDQIVLHRTGPSAMTRAQVAEKLGLSENQQIAIADMVEQRQEALRSGGFRMSSEEREAIGQEWDTNILGTLEGEQLAAWTQMLGDPPPAEPEPQVAIPVAQGGTPATPAGDDEDGVVASFESVDGDPEKMSFNFRYAPWEDVLREFAERADLKPDLIDIPTGTFDYDKKGPYTPVEALDILNGYLIQRGYIIIRRDDFLVSINIDNGIPPNLIPHVSPSQLHDRGRNELMTVVFSVQVEEIDELAEQVAEMLGPQGKAVGITAAQALAVTDLGANLRSVHEMLELQSALTTPETIAFKAYKLEHIAAAEAHDMLRAILGLGFEVQNVSQAGSGGGGGDRDERGGWGNWGRRDNDEDRNRNNQNNTTTASGDLMAKTQMTVNPRTNQLLVAATAAAHVIVEEALVSIDVEDDGNQFSRIEEPYLQVYTLTEADAGEVAKTLTVLMPELGGSANVLNEDGRNDMIHIWATASQHQQVAQWIRELDGLGGGTTVAVIPLSSMDPLTAASTLNSMFYGDGLDAPIIEPNLQGRQLMIRGTSDQVDQIKVLLAGLGEDGTGQRSLADRGRIRSLPLSGRSAQRLLEMIQGPFEATLPNRIQLVPPTERAPVYDLRLPSGWIRTDSPESTDEPETDAPVGLESDDTETTSNRESLETTKRDPAAAATDRLAQVRFVSLLDDLTTDEEAGTDAPHADDAPAEDDGDADEEVVDETPEIDIPLDPAAAAGDEDAPPVYIQIDGDNINVFSDDPEALAAFEYLLEDAMAYVSPQITWKVYPLQTADAVETASMLELLIDGTSVSQKTTTSSTDLLGTLRGFGSSVMSATGLDSSLNSTATLQIIPEPNLNSLFVMGPASKVSELEQFLEILDTPEWPQSYRDRIPRMIPVKHASIDDVYRIVSDVFQDKLNAGQGRGGNGGRGGGGNNPFAAMFGGNGGGENGGAETLLTLGVDEQTSNIIVSADEALYQQIKDLVQSIDTAALEANRTIRVVPLLNTNSSLIQSTLTSLMPRVQVSTSGSRPQTSSSRSGGGDNNDQGGGGDRNEGGDQDQIRRFFEQRIRERTQQQTTGGGFGGDRSGGGRDGGGFGGFGGFGGGRDGGRGGFGGGDRGR